MRTFRALLRQPGYLLLTVMTLALAVGANLVVFTIVNAIWIRPRPVHDPWRSIRSRNLRNSMERWRWWV
jgi:putative ABC transport system permease protein